jgi:glycerate dehydrogenase
MKIVVLDGFTLNPGDNPWTGVESQGELTVYDRTPADKIVERCQGAEIVLTNKTPLTAETLAELPDLKFISVLATGFNVIDIEAARERGIPVSNVPIYGTDSVAQFVFALLLELSHNVALHDKLVKEGAWSSQSDFCFWKTPLMELTGKTMGIVGFGRIGRRTGALAAAFGMKVIAHDLYKGDAPDCEGFEWVEIDELFKRADVVSLHCPLTADNEGFVNASLLNTMKPTSFLINTSRGPLIDQQDLAEALNAGTLAGAAVDVVKVEPIKEDNPLLKAKNCLITPHIAWATLEARTRLMQTTVENVAGFIKGEPVNVVN